MMLTGIEVLFVATGLLLIMWAIILFGSGFFGSTK
jgi:hypothetical protein